MSYRNLINLYDDDVQCNEITTSDDGSSLSLSSVFRRPFSGTSALEPRAIGNQPDNESNSISNDPFSSESNWKKILDLMRSVRRMQMREQELRNQRMRADPLIEEMRRPIGELSRISNITNPSNMFRSQSLAGGIDNLNNDRSTRRLEHEAIHNSSDRLHLSSRSNLNFMPLPHFDFTPNIREPKAGSSFGNDFIMPRSYGDANLKSKSIFSYPKPPKYISLAGEKKLPSYISPSADKRLLESDSNSNSHETKIPVSIPKKRVPPKKLKDFTPPQIKWFNDIANRKGHILNDNSDLYPVGPPKCLPSDNATLSITNASRSQDDLISSDMPWFNQEAMQMRKMIKGKRLITQKSDSDLLTTRF